ncbi:hypothetical protein [Pararhizobium sp.]|uniref:hypothetical protein n=1 Tax=Pararhizobium sp. TaxID=1977563 RepID=UPI003D0C8927
MNADQNRGNKMQVLNRPRQNGPYRDRDIGCQEALEQSFLTLAELHSGEVLDAAAGKLSSTLMALAKRAESVGWTLEEAEVAISELAQNLLDENTGHG